jgi:hypothetical protein
MEGVPPTGLLRVRMRVAVRAPRGPVAVREMLYVPATAVGLPLISPVVVSIETPAGRPVALKEVTPLFAVMK